MTDITLQQLASFDAVVTEGGFQGAADKLLRSQPAVFSSVKALEAQLGLALLDRGAYRVTPTEAGRAFHRKARLLLAEYGALRQHAAQLAIGEESELTVVIGDLCPIAAMLRLLRGFFEGCPATTLHLSAEAIGGPWERLFDDEADLILHHIDKADPRIEFIDLQSVAMIPVVAPGFLDFPVTTSITPEQMRDRPQCIIRDTARQPAGDYYVIEGAPSWTVGDQLTKQEIILQGMGWGHMPDFLVAADLAAGRLVSIAGAHFPGARLDLVAARRRERPRGPVAERLWRYIAEQARQGGRAPAEKSR